MTDYQLVNGFVEDLGLGGSTTALQQGLSPKYYPPNIKPGYYGQTGNTVAGHVANQGIGTVAAPALAALAQGTVTINDALITATSFVFCQVRRGTTAPAAGAFVQIAEVQAPGAGSAVVTLYNDGTANVLATDYQLWYWVVAARGG